MATTPYYALIEGRKVRVPRVTTILGVLDKEALRSWANRLGLGAVECRKRNLKPVVEKACGLDEYIDPLKAIGTLAHAMVEHELGGPKPDLTLYTAEDIDKAENALLSFLEWRNAHTIEPVLTECELVSPTLRVGGRADGLAVVDGELGLFDLKTGSGVYDEAWLQVSAYKAMVLELWDDLGLRPLLGKPPATFPCHILNIPRSEDEEYRHVVVSPEASAVGFEMFKHCREIYRLKRELKVHTTKEYQEWQLAQA